VLVQHLGEFSCLLQGYAAQQVKPIDIRYSYGAAGSCLGRVSPQARICRRLHAELRMTVAAVSFLFHIHCRFTEESAFNRAAGAAYDVCVQLTLPTPH